MPRVSSTPQKNLIGPTSPETVENWRAQGRSDDTIAEYISQTNPDFGLQYGRIKQASGGDPRATTAFLNTRFYGDASYAPQSPEPKGFIGKTLDLVLGYPGRVLNRVNDRLIDVGQAVEDRQEGRQGAINTFGQVAAGFGRIGLSPVTQFSSDVVGAGLGVAGAVDEAVTGGQVKEAIGEKIQEAAPYIQGAMQSYEEAAERNPTVRTLGALGMAGLDTLDVLGTSAAYKKLGGASLERAALHPIQAAKGIPQAVGKGVGATGRAVYQPVRSFASGVKQGFKGTADDTARAAAGTADDAARAAAGTADDTLMPLAGKAKEAVDKGVDEKLVRFITGRNPDERHLMKAMTTEAEKGTRLLGGTNKHKAIVGQQILRNAEYVIEKKEQVGKALGNIAASMGDETVDLTDTAQKLFTEMSNKGVMFNRETGLIVAAAGFADDEIPILQKIANYFQPDDQGRVLRSFRESDLFRKKLFAELDIAKGRLAPTSAGQSAFSASETIASQARSGMLRSMGELNPSYQKLASSYAELSTEPAEFYKFIGYKGNLDDISKAALGTGEKAMRVLGNASDRPTDALQRLFTVARKYGYDSSIDEFQIIRYADELENVFPMAPTRSLRGEVARAGRDVVEGGVKSGPIDEAFTFAKDKAVQMYRWANGMTPENRLRLLNELLDASPEESFLSVADDVVPEHLDDLNRTVAENTTAGEAVRPIAASVPDQSASRTGGGPATPGGAMPAGGAGSTATGSPGTQGGKPLAGTLPQKYGSVNGLTPEEQATGLVGGGGDGIPRIDLAAIPTNAGDHAAVMSYYAQTFGVTPEQLAVVVQKAGNNTAKIEAALKKAFGKTFTSYMKQVKDLVDEGDAPLKVVDIADPIRRAVFNDLPPT